MSDQRVDQHTRPDLEDDPEFHDSRVPVTVLTGFLGSGKTTLLNRILTENHGKRIAVIENEFGEIGIDQDLVISAEEEIFEMNNGCICCTVRGDLIRILGNLMRRKDRFDAIIIETTGMADPGPVVQTFFVDEEMGRAMRLDAIVTMVDAYHVVQHLGDQEEVQEQIAFADVILLNKTDLVAAEELDELEQRIRLMNATAPVYRTQQAAIALDRVLDVRGFSLDRALEIDLQFLEPEHPFEWGGIHDWPGGVGRLRVPAGPDPSMLCAVLPLRRLEMDSLEPLLGEAAALFSAARAAGATLSPDATLPIGKAVNLDLNAELSEFVVDLPAGAWALLTEHHPAEFGVSLSGPHGLLVPVAERAYKPDHEHDETVTSVGLTSDQPIDLDRFNLWMRGLLLEKGPDLFRTKGVLNFDGFDRRYVFQGVHMLLDGSPDAPWGPGPRPSKLIFIGRDLDREALSAGFASCLN